MGNNLLLTLFHPGGRDNNAIIEVDEDEINRGADDDVWRPVEMAA